MSPSPSSETSTSGSIEILEGQFVIAVPRQLDNLDPASVRRDDIGIVSGASLQF